MDYCGKLQQSLLGRIVHSQRRLRMVTLYAVVWALNQRHILIQWEPSFASFGLARLVDFSPHKWIDAPLIDGPCRTIDVHSYDFRRHKKHQTKKKNGKQKILYELSLLVNGVEAVPPSPRHSCSLDQHRCDVMTIPKRDKRCEAPCTITSTANNWRCCMHLALRHGRKFTRWMAGWLAGWMTD
ncbi:unnamed protein product [Ceratitis capitata]|uniref:(Mediterranean fruit fly) hypothetical protein n=1 Tax=Ceratitis capitata TaxID=7213 RepID=A0A811UUA7_CERCA|nr:unnamed protein product [Ceratitis capitata]